MFLPFFDQLRAHKVPVSMREFLAFLDGMAAGMGQAGFDIGEAEEPVMEEAVAEAAPAEAPAETPAA